MKYHASYNPLSSRWLVMDASGNTIRGGLSRITAQTLAEELNNS